MNDFVRARFVLAAPLVASGLLLGGCMSSPTYGTGVTANEQLVGDVTGVLSLAPKRKASIDYKPRPELVTPASTDVLPPPQEDIVTASNEAWPESPEQRRARIRATATANQDNKFFEPEVVNDISVAESKRTSPLGMMDDKPSPEMTGQRTANSARQREEFNQKLAEANQGSPTARKYLSEPPLEYRAPAATAPVGDVGEDELKKQRRIKAAATKSGGWRDLIPWL